MPCEVLEALDGFVMLWEALALEGIGKGLKSLGGFGRLWLEHSMSLTEALGGFGKFWEPLGSLVFLLLEPLQSFVRLLGVLEIFWKVFGSLERLWEALM